MAGILNDIFFKAINTPEGDHFDCLIEPGYEDAAAVVDGLDGEDDHAKAETAAELLVGLEGNDA